MPSTIPPFGYRGWTLFDAIDALMAHDRGARDSGVSDEAMKAEVRSYLGSLGEDELRRVCAEFARKLLTDEAIARGYGLEDVLGFAEWLSSPGRDAGR